MSFPFQSGAIHYHHQYLRHIWLLIITLRKKCLTNDPTFHFLGFFLMKTAIFSIILFFYASQNYNCSRFARYYDTSDFTYQNPALLFLWSVLYIIDSYLAYNEAKAIVVHSHRTAYLRSILFSVHLFSLSMSIICLLIKIGILKPSNIRKGLIAVIQRVFILLRSIEITKIWYNCL